MASNKEFMLGRILMICRKWLGNSLRDQAGKPIENDENDTIPTYVTLHKAEAGRYVGEESLDRIVRFYEARGVTFKETDSHFIVTLSKDAFSMGVKEKS